MNKNAKGSLCGNQNWASTSMLFRCTPRHFRELSKSGVGIYFTRTFKPKIAQLKRSRGTAFMRETYFEIHSRGKKL